MSLRARIEIDNSELKGGLKDAENQANKSFSNIQRGANKTSKTFTAVSDSVKLLARNVSSTASGVVSSLAKIGPVGLTIAAVFTGIGLAVAGSLKFVKNLSDKIFELKKNAASINMNVNEYRAIEHASNKAGIEMEKIVKIFGKLDYAFSKAEDGEKKTIEAFHALGLSWEQLQQKSPVEQLLEVSEAYNNMIKNGGSVDPKFFDIFGKRELQTFNKMKETDYSKLAAEASVFGLDLTPEQIRQAEELATTFKETNEYITNIQASISDATGLTEKWTKTMKAFNKILGNNEGFVNEKFKDRYEGIGDVGKRILLSKEGRASLKDYEKRALIEAFGVEVDAKGTLNQWGQGGKFLPSGEELDREFRNRLTRINWKRLSKQVQKVVFDIAANHDTRFIATDRNTWTQRITRGSVDGTEEIQKKKDQFAKEDVNAEAKRLTKEFDSMASAYESATRKSEKLVDVNKEIERLNIKINEETQGRIKVIDQELQQEMRIKAEKMNQLSIENELARLHKLNVQSPNNAIGNILSTFGGPDNSTMQQIISTIGDYSAEIYGHQFDLRKDFIDKMSAEFKNMTNISETDISRMMDINPAAFKSAFQNVIKQYSQGFAIPSDLDTRLDDNGELLSEERKANIRSIVEELNKLIRSAANANRMMKNLNFFNEKESALTNLKIIEAETDAQYKLVEALKYQQALQKRTKGAVPDDDDLIATQQMENLRRRTEAATIMKNFKDKERELNGRNNLQYAQTFDLKNQLEIQRRLNVLREMGIKMTDENIKKYWHAAGVIVALTKEQERLHKVESMIAKTEQTKAATDLEKAKFTANAKMLDQLEKENFLRENGLRINKENLKLYDAQIKAQQKANAESRNASILQKVGQDARSAQYSAMEKTGYAREAEVAKYLEELRNINGGRPLSKDQMALGARFASGRYYINNAQIPTPQDDVIKTNELAAKGGFNSSVKVAQRDNTETIAKVTENILKLQTQNIALQQQIRNALKN